MSLNTRLVIMLAFVLVSVGVTAVVTSRIAVERYFQETSQEINQNLGMYVVGRLTLLEDTGAVNDTALKELADLAMTVNPSVEVYLLGPEGQVLDHALPPEKVIMDVVRVEPIRDFLDPARTLPVLGDDPRNPGRAKAFSAWPIEHDGRITGYLYIVLGGQKFTSAVDMFAGSYVLRIAGWTLAIAVGVGLVAGALLFRQVTTPLVRLKDSIVAFADSDFADAPDALPTPNTTEVADLNAAFAELAQRLVDQLQRLKENDALRRELVANVSHDLRTPLASMQGYIESLLIKDATLSQSDRREMLAIAHRHTKQLTLLVQELFDLAKLESGSVQPNFERFSLSELLQDVVQEFKLEASAREIELRFAAAPTDVWVFADIGLIQRALSNLVNNALRHTFDGGFVEVRIDPKSEGAQVEVCDNGGGISEAELENIFDRFYQASSDPEGNTAGLGLAIVKRIVELHDSQISVVSQLAEGTTFSFTLPVIDTEIPRASFKAAGE